MAVEKDNSSKNVTRYDFQLTFEEKNVVIENGGADFLRELIRNHIDKNLIRVILHSQNIYVGFIDSNGKAQVKIVKPSGDEELLPMSQSPNATKSLSFMWGYAGTGPRSLAFSLLENLFSTHAAIKYTTDFLYQVIANLHRDDNGPQGVEQWQLPAAEVAKWLQKFMSDNFI